MYQQSSRWVSLRAIDSSGGDDGGDGDGSGGGDDGGDGGGGDGGGEAIGGLGTGDDMDCKISKASCYPTLWRKHGVDAQDELERLGERFSNDTCEVLLHRFSMSSDADAR